MSMAIRFRVVDFTVAGIPVTFPAGSTVAVPGGVLQLNGDGTFNFNPDPDFNGTVPQVTYTIEDGNGGVASSTLDITITPVNDDPVATDNSLCHQ